MPVYPKSKYKKFKETLPDNLRNTPESDYRMKLYWRNNGKPADFDASLQMPEPMFSMEDDGKYHGYSVDPTSLKFLKPKDHPTVEKEIEWFNGESPEAVDFRKQYELKTNKKYFRYKPK
jgi:hypothetical protein